MPRSSELRRGVGMRVNPGGKERAFWPSLAGLGVAWLLASCGNDESAAPPEPGKTNFVNYCSACHQLDGQGAVDGAPPLVRSPWVTGPESRLIRIVLQGVRGSIAVGDQTYDLEMPGFGQLFTDEEIADLLSFVRRRYGESSAPITPDAVGRVREATRDRVDYWTADELLRLP